VAGGSAGCIASLSASCIASCIAGSIVCYTAGGIFGSSAGSISCDKSERSKVDVVNHDTVGVSLAFHSKRQSDAIGADVDYFAVIEGIICN